LRAPSARTSQSPAGTYRGGLTVGLSVKLVGAGAGATIISGGVWKDVFFPPPPNPRLSLTDTTVTGNTLTVGPGITVHGGGLFTTFPITLTDSTISGNSPDNCFGVRC
jgi:hypothetical protein